MPIALQSLIGSSLSLIDNLMVGRLGETELAAVGVGIVPFHIFWMFMFGFTSGTATFMSQFWGAEDVGNIRRTLGFAISVCTSAGLVFFISGMFFPEYIVNIFTNLEGIKPLATEYIRIGSFCFLFLSVTVPFTFCLRSTQQTKIPLYTSAFAMCANTFLNYVLIFGNFGAPKMGVAGAALATVIARALEMLLVLFIVFYKKNIISGKISEYFRWTKDFALKVLNNAIPTTMNETLWGLGVSVCTAAYARMSEPEFAALQAGRVIENLFIMAAFSIGDAALILVGQRLGAGELDYGYALAKKLLKIATATGVVFGIALIAVSRPIIDIFNFSPECKLYTFYILIIYGASMWLVLFNGSIVVGILRAGGDTKVAMLIDCSGIWLIAVPAAFITTQLLHFPIYFVVLCVETEEAAKFTFLLKRFLSKKWVKNVVGGL